MKKLKLCAIITLVIGLLLPQLWAEPDYGQLFMESDGLFPKKAKMATTLINLSNGKESDRVTFTSYLNGKDKYLLVMEKPRILKGQVQLRVADIIYSYSSKTNKVTKVSASAAFMNTTVSQEDIMNSTLSRIYQVGNGAQIELDGITCYRIELVPKEKDAAYKKIVAIINKDTNQLVKREYYSYTGDLVKELLVDDVQKSTSGISRIQFTIIDVLHTGVSTQLIFENIDSKAPISDQMFDIKHLKYIN